MSEQYASEQYVVEGIIKTIVVNTGAPGNMLVVVSPTDGYKVSLSEKTEWTLLRQVKEGQSPTEAEVKLVKGAALSVYIGNVSFQELLLLKNNKQKVRFLLRKISKEPKASWSSAMEVLSLCDEGPLCYECNSIVVL